MWGNSQARIYARGNGTSEQVSSWRDSHEAFFSFAWKSSVDGRIIHSPNYVDDHLPGLTD